MCVATYKRNLAILCFLTHIVQQLSAKGDSDTGQTCIFELCFALDIWKGGYLRSCQERQVDIDFDVFRRADLTS